MTWNQIKTISDLESLINDSHTKPAVIFKHSTSCGISRMVLRRFEADVGSVSTDLSYHFLDLLQFRSLSNEISTRFDIIHESPQLIVIKNGTAIANSSHSAITASSLESV